MRYFICLFLILLTSCGLRQSRVKKDTRRLLKQQYNMTFSVHRIKRFCNEGNRCPLLYSVVCTPEGKKRPRFTAWVSYETSNKKPFLKSDSYQREQEAFLLEKKILKSFEKEVKGLIGNLMPNVGISAILIDRSHFSLYLRNNSAKTYNELVRGKEKNLKRIITITVKEESSSHDKLYSLLESLVNKYQNSFYIFIRFRLVCKKQKDQLKTATAPVCREIDFPLHRDKLDSVMKTLTDIRAFLRENRKAKSVFH